MKYRKPDHLTDQQWSEYIQEKARTAIRLDLRDYDWMTLDPELARKIHALLPHHPDSFLEPARPVLKTSQA